MRKKSSLVAENTFFPVEILIEILSFLEAKYLLRCKSVCKFWCAVTRSKQLVEMHLMRNGHRYYNMHMHITDGSVNSDGIIQKIEYKCHPCRGLVLSRLSAGSSSVTYRISNPTTNYSMDLPSPHKGMISMHVFINISTGSYNVLSIYFNKEKETRHLELLDLGGQSNDPCPNTDLSWTTLNVSEFENVSTHQICHSKYLMSTKGSILYILHSTYHGSTKLKITCVDIVRLTCTTLDMPVTLLWTGILGFQFWRDRPSVVFILEDELNILALEDYKTQKWADTKVFPLPFFENYPIWIIEPRIYTDDTEDIFYCETRYCGRQSVILCPQYYVYKLKSKVQSLVPSLPWMVPATLVSVRGMQPEKKEAQVKLSLNGPRIDSFLR